MVRALIVLSILCASAAGCAAPCPAETTAAVRWAPDAVGPLPLAATMVLDDDLTIELTCTASGCEGGIDDIGTVVSSFTYVVEGEEGRFDPRDILVETDPVACVESYVVVWDE